MTRRHLLSVTKFSILLLLHVLPCIALAGNVSISNIQTGQYDYAAGNVEVKFDVSWENSWRLSAAPGNWDAVWLFVKYRANGGNWTHARLNSTGHSAPSGMTISTGLADTGAVFNISTNPGVGVFLYRSGEGTGNLSLSNVTLSWNYAANGVTSGNTIDFKVFGIEMVYVPQGAFYAGDDATGNGAFRQGSSDNDPWYIGSENAISVTNSVGNGTGAGQTAGVYYYVQGGAGGGDTTGSVFTIPAALPKGFAGFYVMKGEISQAQWIGFFNTLTTAQKTTRDITSNTNGGKNSDAITFRNNISWNSGTPASDATLNGGTHGGVAATYLLWGDLVAYLDWAGLRPMSELEYEKAGRGPVIPVGGEYAWGTIGLAGATGIENSGLLNERGLFPSNITYNNVVGLQGPTRVGSYGSGQSTRVLSGAGYYGAFDLSGSVWERTVTVGESTTGRLFDGTKHGDGTLDVSGDADQSGWPSTSAIGAGFRGGGWRDLASVARLSDRDDGANHRQSPQRLRRAWRPFGSPLAGGPCTTIQLSIPSRKKPASPEIGICSHVLLNLCLRPSIETM
jgi:formylglycine-generating enzyme required for sulfatase activity